MQEASNQKVQEQINYRIGAERMLKALPRWAELTELLELVVCKKLKKVLSQMFVCAIGDVLNVLSLHKKMIGRELHQLPITLKALCHISIF